MTEAQPVITVAGKQVALGPMRRDLIPLYQAWINNIETTMFLGMGARPMSLDEEAAWFERVVRSESSIPFTIFRVEDWQAIGTVSLHKVDKEHRTCELGVMIGEQTERHKGFGTEAVQLAVDYAFYVLNMHSVMLLTYEFNFAGQIAYERAGFKEIGRRRQARFHAGRYWDIVYMDVLESEFQSPVLKAQMTPPDRR